METYLVEIRYMSSINDGIFTTFELVKSEIGSDKEIKAIVNKHIESGAIEYIKTVFGIKIHRPLS